MADGVRGIPGPGGGGSQSDLHPEIQRFSGRAGTPGLLSFRVTHDDPSGDGSVVEYPVECALSRSQSAPALEFTRQVPARSVTSGADVLLIYRVRNTGNVPLTDIRVQDGEFDRRLDRLDCGESHAFVNRITVSQSTRSSARVSCVAQDGENTSLQQQLEITLQPVSPSLEVTLTLDKQTGPVGGTVNGVVTLAAAGGDVTDISLWDAVNGTLMADALELHEGESVTLTCAWPIRESAAYRVRARGYAADGSVLVGVSGEAGARALRGIFQNCPGYFRRGADSRHFPQRLCPGGNRPGKYRQHRRPGRGALRTQSGRGVSLRLCARGRNHL